jgi:hypothetical protein
MAKRITRHPARYQGQEVTLVGYFRGADLLNEVILSAPEDRLKDWVIADASGAIWVAWRGVLPFPSASHEVWRIVRVRGTVAMYAGGTPYLIPSEATWEGLTETYSVLPALCSVAIHRFGGADDLSHHVYWYQARTLTVVDDQQEWNGIVTLSRREASDLERAFKQAKFTRLPDTVGEACEGCVRYYIAAVDANKNTPHYVTAYEGSLPRRLQAFIDLSLERAAAAEEIQ